jgi:hypothetical protein
MMEICGKRRKQLLDDIKERRGCRKLTEKALDCTLWRTDFARGDLPVTRHATELINYFRVTKSRRMSGFGHVTRMGGEAKRTQGFGGETCRKGTTWETQAKRVR